MHRNDIVCFIPLAGVALLFEVPFWAAALLTTPAVNEALIIAALAVQAIVLLAGAAVFAGFLVQILRRKDFGGTQKAAWIAILFAAGPLGPPTYWFGVARPPLNDRDRLGGRS